MLAPTALRLGWSTVDVTPPRPVNLHGQFHARISADVLDPLTATALAIQSAAEPEQAVVFVACDRCGVPSRIVNRVREAVGPLCPDLDPQCVILHATHTHTAPTILEGMYPPQAPEVMTPTEYGNLFVERVSHCVADAWAARTEGAVSWGMGWAVVGHNRRTAYHDDLSQRPGARGMDGRCLDRTSKMYGPTDDPQFAGFEGDEDHAVELLFTYDGDEALTGVVVNLVCPSQEVEGLSQVSADFWHDIRVELRRRLGEGVEVLAQCSAAGDQSPHPLVHRAAEDRMLALKGTNRREEYARRVADAVGEALPLASLEVHREVPFAHVQRELSLPRRMVTEAEAAEVRSNLAGLRAETPDTPQAASVNWMRTNRCNRILQRYAEQAAEPELNEELHVVRLGDVAFATNRFELFLDYGFQMKTRSRALQTFVVQLAGGGNHTGTYLPTAKGEAGGGYSATVYCNEVGSEGGRKLVEETVAAINGLF
ncbi:MAG: hypothetical protein HYU66_13550 [Armatimonadetes bacterium]|nr:hypothetical protein [Armatimonadota bacterium]